MRSTGVVAVLGGTFLLGALVGGPWGPAGATPPPEARVEVLFSPTGHEQVLQSTIGDLIQGARSEVLVAMYQFTSRRLSNALQGRARAGLRVGVLLDEEQNRDSSYSVADDLVRAGCDVRYVDLPGRGSHAPKFHHKFAVIDGSTVVTGSYNWTVLGDEENHENAVILQGSGIASRYRDRFRSIWEDEDLTVPAD